MNALCDEEELQALIAAIQDDDTDEMMRVDRMIARFPLDPRLHFLRGSILASIGRPIEALPALRTAVDLAPDFAIARFQLGFFQLTSGEALDAFGTWGPLALLPEEHYLRLFVGGLTHLIRDEFDEAVARLNEGIALNEENPVLNRDMKLIVDQIEAIRQDGPSKDGDGGATSATSFLLDQLSARGRVN